MNLTNWIRYGVVSIVVLLIQIMVLNQVDLTFGEFNYISILIYPYLILILPFGVNRYLQLILGFVVGILVDIASGTYGIHASATVFLAFIRPYILSFFEPSEGYPRLKFPSVSHEGVVWILLITAISVMIHHLFLFSVDAFAFIYLSEILLRTIFSFLVSTLAIMLAFVLFNLKS